MRKILLKTFQLLTVCIVIIVIVIAFIKITHSLKHYNIIFKCIEAENTEVSSKLICRGLEIGEIIETKLTKDNAYLIAEIENKYKIPRNSKCKIMKRGIISRNSIVIEMSDEEWIYNPKDTILLEPADPKPQVDVISLIARTLKLIAVEEKKEQIHKKLDTLINKLEEIKKLN